MPWQRKFWRGDWSAPWNVKSAAEDTKRMSAISPTAVVDLLTIARGGRKTAAALLAKRAAFGRPMTKRADGVMETLQGLGGQAKDLFNQHVAKPFMDFAQPHIDSAVGSAVGQQVQQFHQNNQHWMNPALMGAGIGGALGLGSSLLGGKRKRVLSDTLTGALLGGTAGGAYGAVTHKEAPGSVPEKVPTLDTTSKMKEEAGKIDELKTPTPPGTARSAPGVDAVPERPWWQQGAHGYADNIKNLWDAPTQSAVGLGLLPGHYPARPSIHEAVDPLRATVGLLGPGGQAAGGVLNAIRNSASTDAGRRGEIKPNMMGLWGAVTGAGIAGGADQYLMHKERALGGPERLIQPEALAKAQLEKRPLASATAEYLDSRNALGYKGAPTAAQVADHSANGLSTPKTEIPHNVLAGAANVGRSATDATAQVATAQQQLDTAHAMREQLKAKLQNAGTNPAELAKVQKDILGADQAYGKALQQHQELLQKKNLIDANSGDPMSWLRHNLNTGDVKDQSLVALREALTKGQVTSQQIEHALANNLPLSIGGKSVMSAEAVRKAMAGAQQTGGTTYLGRLMTHGAPPIAGTGMPASNAGMIKRVATSRPVVYLGATAAGNAIGNLIGGSTGSSDAAGINQGLFGDSQQALMNKIVGLKANPNLWNSLTPEVQAKYEAMLKSVQGR